MEKHTDNEPLILAIEDEQHDQSVHHCNEGLLITWRMFIDVFQVGVDADLGQK